MAFPCVKSNLVQCAQITNAVGPKTSEEYIQQEVDAHLQAQETAEGATNRVLQGHST